MKKIIFFISFICGVLTIQAQNFNLREKYIYGRFVHLFAGPAFLPEKEITGYLRQDDVLGNTYSPKQVGYTLGGEGGLMFDRFYIGGGIFGLIKPLTSSYPGKASVSLWGAYVKTGYRFYSTKNSFMHVYAGLGGMGYMLEIKNLGDSSLHFNHNSPVSPGQKETYSVRGLLFEAGMGLKRFIISGSDADKNAFEGLMIGMDAGFFTAIPVSGWNSRNAVSGPPELPVMLSPYIRITLGIAGFRHEAGPGMD